MEVRDLEGPELEIAGLLIDGHSAPHVAQRLNLSERAARARIRVIFAKLGVSNALELRRKEQAEEWRRTYARIRAFVEAHGHSRVPDGYSDEHGRLDGLVGNILLHHSGRAWLGESPPPRELQMYGSVDWEADLDRLEGWSWGLDDPSEFPLLRSRRYATRVIRDLGLEGGGEADYVRGVTAALRTSEEPPWPRIRELVKDKGIDPSAAVLADFFPDRYGTFLGVIVGAHGRAFGFCLLFFGDPEDPSWWNPIKLFDWRELSEHEARKPHEEQIRIGIGVLEKEST
jgi:hypothetical protein